MSFRRVNLVFAAVAVLAAMLAPTSVALGQQLSAEDQYVDTGPTGNGLDDVGGTEGGSGAESTSTGDASPAANAGGGESRGNGERGGERAETVSAAGAGQADGGSLPLTGYPMTPLVGLVLAMLAVALAGRLLVRVAASRQQA